MKNTIKITMLSIVALALLSTGCSKEVEPQGGTATREQVAGSTNAIMSYIAGINAFMNNYNTGGGANHWDFGYPALIVQREMMGQDIAYPGNYGQWNSWYGVTIALGPDYAVCQYPWRWYYRLVLQTNNIIELVPDPDGATKENVWALGSAYFYRAFAYFDMGRLYLSGSYANNPEGLTVPIVTPETENPRNNPRVPASQLFQFVLEDLKKAEIYLADYVAPNENTPSLQVVYGMFARVYLEIGEWALAEQYAKLAQQGYSPLTEGQWTDPINGFNTPSNNNSWMFCTTATSNNDVVKTGIINWTSHMTTEQTYGYGGPGAEDYMAIDQHLFSLIPATDFRKKSYKGAAGVTSNFPYYSYIPTYGSVKFRPAKAGYTDFTVGSASAVPLMRVEEMMLIEAEAATRQDMARGKQLLETFVKTYRNPAYTSTGSSPDLVVSEIWLQRRIELWGEGFSLFDIKRLNKPVIRSYSGTNHRVGYRFNTDAQPSWMNFCIVRTEFNNNVAVDPAQNNPAPVTPKDSPNHVW